MPLDGFLQLDADLRIRRNPLRVLAAFCCSRYSSQSIPRALRKGVFPFHRRDETDFATGGGDMKIPFMVVCLLAVNLAGLTVHAFAADAGRVNLVKPLVPVAPVETVEDEEEFLVCQKGFVMQEECAPLREPSNINCSTIMILPTIAPVPRCSSSATGT
jgi:hypothetical protein